MMGTDTMRRSLGFTTFTVTLLLITILIGVSLLVGKLMVVDRRITLNEVQYRQALALAELGIADGIGRLAYDTSWRTSGSGTTVSSATGSYTLTALNDTALNVGSVVVTPVRVRAQATLADTTTRAAVEVKTVSVNVLAGTPAAPLTVAGGMVIGGNFTAVANPNGGGLGVPLSVWTNDDVGGHGSWQTCHQGDYSVGCSSNLSDNSHKNSDIKDNDPDFPTDLVWYLFNQPDTEEGWLNLEALAVQRVNDCNGLTAASSGLIIVDGDCAMPGEIGSVASPVILIVRDGALTMNGGSVFNGLIFGYSSDPATIVPDAKANGTATVNGALVANFPLEITSGTFNAVYDASVLQNLGSGAAFKRINIIPGSWRDW